MIEAVSAWIIWPIFSSSVILASRPSTKASVAGSTRPWLLAAGHKAGWAVLLGPSAAKAGADRRVVAISAMVRVLVFMLPRSSLLWAVWKPPGCYRYRKLDADAYTV